VGVVGSFAGEIEGLAKKLTLDLTNELATTTAALEEFPEAIVNCAAVSVPEVCEADHAVSQALNVALPTTLARLAHHLSARFVHLSSEQVFDGQRPTPYGRDDPPSPINLYGRQKIESERAVHLSAPTFAVTLRAPLLMGNSAAGRRSTHERLLADWSAGKTAKLFVDEFRQPCTAENLAEAMLELGERREPCGVFHWAGAELISRYQLGRRIREYFKLTEQQAPILGVARAEVPGATEKRQACLALDLAPLRGELKTSVQTIAAQLEELHVPAPCREWYFRQT
jgi:dTDP-4-dehydrorhamnose reductase